MKSFKSNNWIPKQVRKQMKRKFEASKGLKTVKSVKRCLKLREKLESAENELKKMFLEKKLRNENVAIAKIKRNPKVFFSMAKKKQKTFEGVGPFLKENGDLIDKSEAEALKRAYDKAFSEPNENEKIQDPKEFFTISEENKITIENIPMTRADIKEAIDELSATSSPGPD